MKIKYSINQDNVIKPGDWVVYKHHEEPRAYLVDKISNKVSILLRYDRLLVYSFEDNPTNDFELKKVVYGNPNITYDPSDEKLYKRRLNENKL